MTGLQMTPVTGTGLEIAVRFPHPQTSGDG